MMKNVLYSLLLACLMLSNSSMAQAKSMKDLLVDMPDEILPYLNKNMRLELTELQEMGVEAEVKNSLGEKCVMDTLTDNFMQLRLSEVATCQMKKVTTQPGDTLVCLVKTFAGPEKESELVFYTQNWKKTENQRLLEGKTMEEWAEALIQKPDTMSEERFAELKRMIEPRMVNAELLPHEDVAILHLALPLLSADDKRMVNAICVQKRVKYGSCGKELH